MNPPALRSRRLRGAQKCEVAVIGAGLTGALIVHSLMEAGFEVVLVDKRTVAGGSTSASTALVQYEIDVPLSQLSRMKGRAAAVRSYQRCWEAIGELESLVQELPEPCGFQRRHSLQFASRPRDVATLQTEGRLRRKMGLEVEYLDRGALARSLSFRAPGALWSRDAAVVDPYRLAQCLIQGARRRGLRIFDRTTVDRWETSRTHVQLMTAGGTITARHLVVAGGFESQAYLEKKVVELKSTYAIATNPLSLPQAHRDLTLWETARPYHYLRSTADGRLLMGGEDEDFSDPDCRDALINQKAKKLRQAIRDWYPDLQPRIDFAWAGTFGETRDGLPYIGSLPGRPRVSFALCYGANGTNFAVIAAALLRDRLLGRRNRDASLFSLNR